MSTRNILAVAAAVVVAATAGFLIGSREGDQDREEEADEALQAPSSGSAVAQISDDSARVLALAQVPGGRIADGGLETEDGKLLYSFDVSVPGKEGVEEIHIDAMTGALLGHEHETDESEAQEKKAETKKGSAS